MHLFTALLLLGCSLAAQSQIVYPSRFWEISGNGLSEPSYLYGTMHVSKKVAFNLPDTFFIALNNVDVVALETNPDISLDEMIGSELFRLVNTNDGMSPVSQFYKSAFAFTVPDNRDYGQLLSMNNDLVNQMMFRFSDMLRQSDFEESTFLDLFIYQSGKRLKKKITGLETFDGAMKYFLKAVNPANNKEDEDSDSTQVVAEEESEDYDDYAGSGMMFSRIEDAYRSGNLDLLDSLSRKTYPNKLYGFYLIDQRNIVMADAMDSIMRKEALFAAVGSAHLPGTEGVIELLRKKGYTVRPISLEKGKNAQSTKEKIEAMRLPVVYGTFTSEDQAFKVDVPEKMYAVNLFGEMKQYLALNSANAAYYTVYRVKTYDGITGYSPAKNQQRFDSLFYENIPGKIVRKSAITRNGFPGYDLLARSQNGDMRRYHIFFTPLEVMVFEAAATGDYVESKEIDRFFTSIQLNVPLADELQVYRPEQGGYEVQLPPYRIFDKKLTLLRNTKSGESAMAADAKGNTYFLFRNFLHDIDYIEEDTFELAYLTEMFNRKLEYETISRAYSTQDRHPALETVFKSPEGKYLFVKTVINGQHYYLQAVLSAENTRPAAYFGSLKFVQPVYPGVAETFSDTGLHYSVRTHIKPLEEQVVDYASYNSLENDYSYDEDDEPKPYEFIHERKTYINPYNLEQIDLLYEKIHDYYYAWNVDSFWNSEVKYMSGRLGMSVSGRRQFQEDGVNYCEYMATDTNSSRAILTRIMQLGGRMYYLRSVIDTIDGPSPWVKAFYATFKPDDTLIGLDPFLPKFQHFFACLEGTDSLQNREAADVADYIDLADSVAPQLAKFLLSDNYYRYSQDDRETLIAGLGYLKHPEALPALQQLYEKAGDTSALHFTILRAMAYQRNTPAAALIKKVLMEDTPLPSFSYELSQVFYPWYDTLELVANWFPDMLDIADFDEYRSHVFGMLATLVDSGKIQPAAYATGLNKILTEANQTLKRYNSKEQKNTAAKLAEEADEEAGRESTYHSTVSIGEEAGELKDFMSILLPHIQQPNVKGFFDKLGKMKDDEMLIELYSRLAAANLPVADTVWDHYARDIDWRAILYNALDARGQLDKFPAAYKNQDALCRSMLKNDGYAGKKDTITLLERVQVFTRNDSGWLYFYKCYYGREKKYYFDYVGLQPLDETKLTTRFYDEDGDEVSYHSQGVKWKESKITELKRDVIDEYRLRDRQRVDSDDYDYADELSSILGDEEDY